MSRLRNRARTALLRAGYRVDAVRYIPRALRDPEAAARLTFDDVVCRRMVEANRPLTFLQVGVHDGVTNDPLYPYIRDHGWTGVLVEPQPADCRALEALHQDRPGVTVVQAAIGAARGSAPLYTVAGDDLPAWAGGLASFSRETILKHRDLLPGLEQRIVRIDVPMVPFDEVLTRFEQAPDVLQIDTEGGDAVILSLFPFARLRPAIVHWEVKHLSLADTDACMARLAGYGYRFAPSGGEDMLALLGR